MAQKVRHAQYCEYEDPYDSFGDLSLEDQTVDWETADSNVNDVVELCSAISAYEDVRVSVRRLGAAATAVGASALVVGLLAGPVGFVAGGAVGSVVGGLVLRGRYKTLPTILKGLSRRKKKKLFYKIARVLGKKAWKHKSQLFKLVMGNSTLEEKVKTALLDFVRKVLKGKVIRNEEE